MHSTAYSVRNMHLKVSNFFSKKTAPTLNVRQTLMTSKNIITDVSKCLLRQKHAFNGFNSSQKDGPDFRTSQTDPDDL